MKKKYLKLGLIMACLFPSAAAMAQGGLIQLEWRTISSGQWDDPQVSGGVWKYYKNSTQGWINRTQANGPDKGVPRSTVSTGNDLTLQTPHKNPQTISRLFIETGASLKALGDTLRVVRFYGDTLGVNGQLGGAGGASMIDLQIYTGTETGYAKSLLVIGSGDITVNSFRLGASTLPASFNLFDTVNIQRNVNVVGGMFSLFANTANNAPADSLIMNIAPTATVKLSDSSNFHMKLDSTAKVSGHMTYNINGKLDLSASTGPSNFIAPSNTESILAMNVSGLLLMGKYFNTLPSAYGTGHVRMTINSGGVVDAAAVITPNASFGARQWVVNGTGIFKRYVSSADTIFPVTKMETTNNSVLLNTTTADTFNVSAVAPTYSFVGGQTVNTEWRINKKSTGNAALKASFMWTTADQASAMTAVSVYVYTGAQWKEYPATLSGTGTVASPYKATVTGTIDSIKIAYVGTVGLVLPPNPTGIKNINANNSQLSVAPNPVSNGSFAIQMKDAATGAYSIAVYNVTGQKVYNQTIQHVVGSNVHTVALPAGLSSGVYQLSVTGNEFSAVKKLVIQ